MMLFLSLFKASIRVNITQIDALLQLSRRKISIPRMKSSNDEENRFKICKNKLKRKKQHKKLTIRSLLVLVSASISQSFSSLKSRNNWFQLEMMLKLYSNNFREGIFLGLFWFIQFVMLRWYPHGSWVSRQQNCYVYLGDFYYRQSWLSHLCYTSVEKLILKHFKNTN